MGKKKFLYPVLFLLSFLIVFCSEEASSVINDEEIIAEVDTNTISDFKDTLKFGLDIDTIWLRIVAPNSKYQTWKITEIPYLNILDKEGSVDDTVCVVLDRNACLNQIGMGQFVKSGKIYFGPGDDIAILNYSFEINTSSVKSIYNYDDTLDFGGYIDTLKVVMNPSGVSATSWKDYTMLDILVMNLSKDSGTYGDTLTAIIDRDSSLHEVWDKCGNYSSAKYHIFSPNNDGLNLNYKVQLSDSGTPELYAGLMNPSFGFSMTQNTLQMMNLGGGALSWQVESKSGLCYIEPDSGLFDENINVTIDRSGLSNGLYRDTLLITTNAGDTVIYTEAFQQDTATLKDLHDYWPMKPGNEWCWVAPAGDYWWHIIVDSAFNVNGNDIWKVDIDDSDGSSGWFWFAYNDGEMAVIHDTALFQDLPNIIYDSPVKVAWDGTKTFPLFIEDITPGSCFDVYRNVFAYSISGTLDELLSFYPVWEEGYKAINDFCVENYSDCIALTREENGRNEFINIVGRDIGPILWDGMMLCYAKVDGTEFGTLPPNPADYHSAVSEDRSSDLLYWYWNDNFDKTYFTGVYYQDTIPVPTMLIKENEEHEKDLVIFLRPDFIPASIITPGGYIGLHNVKPDTAYGSDTAFDSTNALLFYNVGVATGNIVANISPADPYAILEGLENYYNQDFSRLDTLMRNAGIENYEHLLAYAYGDGNYRKWQSMATIIGVGASLLAWQGTEIAALNDTTSRGINFSPIPMVNDMVKTIAQYIWDELNGKHLPRPGVPVVQLLQCQGTKKGSFGLVCHDQYLWPDIIECVEICEVSTKCFVNICMPRMVAVDEVEEKMKKNNAGITKEEYIDALKGLFSAWFK